MQVTKINKSFIVYYFFVKTVFILTAPQVLYRYEKTTSLTYNPNSESELAAITATDGVMPYVQFTDSDDKTIQFISNRNGRPHRQEEDSFCRRSFDGRGGYCILSYNCLHVIREYRLHGTKIDICTYSKNVAVICCPLPTEELNEQRISARKCQEYYNEVKDLKLPLTTDSYGDTCVSSIRLIVGGKATQKNEYPHMAAVGWTEENKQYDFRCGGSLVSDEFVLTAAHCITFREKPPDMVRLGAQYLHQSTNSVKDIKVLMTVLHPKYRSSYNYYDIALIKLTERVKFSPYIQPACLWQWPKFNTSTAIATGWGQTEFKGEKALELQKVVLNIIDDKTCKEIYGKERRLDSGISEEQFCAGHVEGGKDTCQGDSGGPLNVELPEFKCVKFIIGITSFGEYCAAPNGPGVYTKIYSYLDWIETVVFKNAK